MDREERAACRDVETPELWIDIDRACLCGATPEQSQTGIQFGWRPISTQSATGRRAISRAPWLNRLNSNDDTLEFFSSSHQIAVYAITHAVRPNAAPPLAMVIQKTSP
jgi:hypothetical protein